MTVDGLYSPEGSKHAVRVRRFQLAATAYALCVPLIVIAHLLGFIQGETVIVFGLLAALVNGGFWFLFRTRLNERFADPSLTWQQVLIGNAVLMYVVYHFDHDRGLALMMCLVILSFGSFRFSTRQFFLAAGVILALLAFAIIRIEKRMKEPSLAEGAAA